MQLHGFTINGDEDGLEYLVANASALQQFVDEIKLNGEASFFYQSCHFIVMPTPSGGYIVSRGHRRRGGSLGQRLRHLI